jgi:glycosyltransferase involved in cell wall biosynthesis
VIRVTYDIAPMSLNRAGEYRLAAAMMGALDARDDVDLHTVTLTRRRPETGLQRVLYQGLTEAVYYPLMVGRAARRDRADIVHYPRHLVTPAAGVNVPTVLTLSDIIPITHPQYFSDLIVLHQRLVTPGAARRATRVMTGSHATRDAILDAWGLPEERVAVVPYGVEPRFRPVEPDPELTARLELDGTPYVLCVGTLEPRKNLVGVIRAMARVHERFPEHALVVTGGRGWRTAELDAELARSRTRVVPAGYVSDDDLVSLYSGAACFAYPSFLEGFGFPVLEAMACGAPVVTSDRSSLPEVAGDAAVLVDPHDPDAIAEGIAAVLGDADRAAELRRRGRERARALSWESTAEGTVRVYREALGSP